MGRCELKSSLARCIRANAKDVVTARATLGCVVNIEKTQRIVGPKPNELKRLIPPRDPFASLATSLRSLNERTQFETPPPAPQFVCELGSRRGGAGSLRAE